MEIIFRYNSNTPNQHISISATQHFTHNLMKHETLAVNLHRYPFDVAVYLRVLDFEFEHVPFDRTIAEWLSDGEIVEVAVRQTAR